MQPMLHMSTPLVYVWDPKSISGALYHLVATYSVRIGKEPFYYDAIERTRPKSATFTTQSEFTSIFEAFKSLWIS